MADQIPLPAVTLSNDFITLLKFENNHLREMVANDGHSLYAEAGPGRPFKYVNSLEGKFVVLSMGKLFPVEIITDSLDKANQTMADKSHTSLISTIAAVDREDNEKYIVATLHPLSQMQAKAA